MICEIQILWSICRSLFTALKTDLPKAFPEMFQGSVIVAHERTDTFVCLFLAHSWLERFWDIVLLIDSNGKFLDPHKFSYNKRLRLLFCPTIASAAKEIRDSELGTPSNLIIHVGTKDIETNPVEVCQSKFQDLLQLPPQRYPTSKVILSFLLKRNDDKDQLRSDLNAKLGQICVKYPNVHIVKNDNISKDHLLDNEPQRRNLQQDETKQTQTEETITFPVFPRHLHGQPSSRVPAASPWCQLIQQTGHSATLSSPSFWFAKSTNCQHVQTWSWRPTFLCGNCQQASFSNNTPNWFSTICNCWPEHCSEPVKTL